MTTPPPLPPAGLVRRATFKAHRSLSMYSFDYKLIEESLEKAEEWINTAKPGEIVQIQTFESSTLAVTVVWYR